MNKRFQFFPLSNCCTLEETRRANFQSHWHFIFLVCVHVSSWAQWHIGLPLRAPTEKVLRKRRLTAGSFYGTKQGFVICSDKTLEFHLWSSQWSPLALTPLIRKQFENLFLPQFIFSCSLPQNSHQTRTSAYLIFWFVCCCFSLHCFPWCFRTSLLQESETFISPV